MKNYLIYSPDYRTNSGGIKVLHRLCHLLNEKGQKAYITSKITNPLWNTPTKELPDENDIMIYPEIVSGNPLKAKYVVRYILNKPGFLGGDKTFDENEMLFTIHKELYPDIPDGRILDIPVIEEELFNNKEKYERDLITCWIGNSIKLNPNISKSTDWIEITHSFPETREPLALMFKKSKMFVCYHTLTSLISEALLCGCPVVIIEDGFITKEQFKKDTPDGYGVIWGFNDIEQATQDVSKYPELYKDRFKNLDYQLQDFIQQTQSVFK